MATPETPAAATFDVVEARASPGLGGYYADDLRAVQAGAAVDGLVYRGDPITPGHRHIRNPAMAVVIGLRSSGGGVGWGDAVTVQYSGFGGREPPIDPSALIPQLDVALEALRSAGAMTFQEACGLVESVRIDHRLLHSGVRYGLSQALLALAASATHRPPARLLADLLGTELLGPVPIYAQSGEERRRNTDKMILKRVDVIPHGLINSPAVFGPDGGRLLEYAEWVRRRIGELGSDGYDPLLHFDVYGLLGSQSGADVTRMAQVCERLVEVCRPHRVQLESPVYGTDAQSTLQALSALRATLARNGIPVAIVADDWCNTIEDITRFLDSGAVDLIQIKLPDLGAVTNALEAVRACRRFGAGVFIGGSCSETDVSARTSVQLAVAAAADQVLAKPGMGVDEALSITRNEMQRVCM
jgi:methylaspartate ammonia-lyase